MSLKVLLHTHTHTQHIGFPSGSDGKEPDYNAGDPGSTPMLERSPGEGNGNPVQYSCLENPVDRGAWQATYSPWVNILSLCLFNLYAEYIK